MVGGDLSTTRMSALTRTMSVEDDEDDEDGRR